MYHLLLNNTELFSAHLSDIDKKNMDFAITNRLSQNNVGIIAPEHIAADITQLKLKAKAGSASLLGEAISLYEDFNGRIRLFNLGTSSAGRSPIPIYIPFVAGMNRNRALENDPNVRPTSPAIFMNMYRIGNWNAEETQYIGISAITDLYAELESALIMYKMLIEGRATKVLSEKKVIESLTRIYTFMFNKAVTRISRSVVGNGDFMKSAAEFLIANFFLRYVLEMPESESLDNYAYNSIDGRVSLTALKDFANSVEIDYSSLSAFLASFGKAVASEEISLIKFQTGWITTFGEGLLLAIEYLPYLLHFLIGVVRGSSMGGVSRLMIHKPDLNKRGLDLLYRSLVSELR